MLKGLQQWSRRERDRDSLSDISLSIGIAFAAAIFPKSSLK